MTPALLTVVAEIVHHVVLLAASILHLLHTEHFLDRLVETLDTKDRLCTTVEI